MSTTRKLMERRLRLSGVLLILGLIIEALSLIWIHPLAFLAFMFIGGGFLIAGAAVYLYSLVSIRAEGPKNEI